MYAGLGGLWYFEFHRMNASCTTYILGVIHLLSGVNRQGMLLFLFNAARILQYGFCLRGITNASEAPKVSWEKPQSHVWT